VANETGSAFPEPAKEDVMTKTYVYIPFPSQDINDSVVQGGRPKEKMVIYSNLSVFDASGKYEGNTRSRGHFIERSGLGKITRGVRPLSAVGPKDVLEISAHGVGGDGAAVSANLIAAQVNLRGKDGGLKGTAHASLTADTLASRLEKDGLTRSIRDVRLMVCYSGLEDGFVFGRIFNPIGLTSADCLASLLAKALGKRGYKSVIVSGATGEVMNDEVDFGLHDPAKAKFQWGSRRFNWRGERVDWAYEDL
jgi:hypothetical protein